jgi:hypothetical protein
VPADEKKRIRRRKSKEMMISKSFILLINMVKTNINTIAVITIFFIRNSDAGWQ